MRVPAGAPGTRAPAGRGRATKTSDVVPTICTHSRSPELHQCSWRWGNEDFRADCAARHYSGERELTDASHSPDRTVR